MDKKILAIIIGVVSIIIIFGIVGIINFINPDNKGGEKIVYSSGIHHAEIKIKNTPSGWTGP